MTNNAINNLMTGLIFQNVAQNYFEGILHETANIDKHFIKQLINRLKANKNDLYSRTKSEEDRKEFLNEFQKEDALFYAEVFLALLEMDKDKRELVEKIVIGIKRGEIIEFDASNTY